MDGNVGDRLSLQARNRAAEPAVVVSRRGGDGKLHYRHLSFQQLDERSTRIAAGLQQLGLRPGQRLALLVPQGLDFVTLVFALLKSGAVSILIDPGMGRKNLVQCLSEAQPEGFVGIGKAHLVRMVLRRRFPQARLNVAVGRRLPWGGTPLRRLESTPLDHYIHPQTDRRDPASIIFTTGSTGPPKGVLYEHGNFLGQIDRIQQQYAIQPGERDLPGFPLFALFNCTMGVTTIIPRMDPTRPANVDPREIIEPIRDWEVTQSFGSPALWNTVGRFCEKHDQRMPSLRRVLSAGAPVPAHVVRRVRQAIHPEGDIHTPYGATESLPVATISGREILEETESQTACGRGVCVGRRFSGIQWSVIAIDDGPLPTLADTRPLPAGEIGELMVSGDVVTQRYVTRVEANALHKVKDGDRFWHRLGDLGYLDESDRFWFCGRKSHRVPTASGELFTIPCEAIFNQHPDVYRSALVGIGKRPRQTPILFVEPWAEKWPADASGERRLLDELRSLGEAHPLTENICDIRLHRALPVDIRHNSKIFREKLAQWATPSVKPERATRR